ncbi:MAG: TMEM175 family protein [Candidatus Eiseniibacteriota bacterium]
MEPSKSHVRLEHVISFSDAIFAFSITIVLLSIQVPQLPTSATESDLVKELWKLQSSFESYAISFGVIGVYWVSYHKVFGKISGSHPLLTGVNLIFLFFVTLISLFTVLNINYGSFHIVFILYTVILVLTGSALALIWVVAVKTKSIEPNMSPSLRNVFLIQSIMPPVIFLISIGISFVSIDVAQYFWLTIIPSRLIISRRLHTQHK